MKNKKIIIGLLSYLVVTLSVLTYCSIANSKLLMPAMVAYFMTSAIIAMTMVVLVLYYRCFHKKIWKQIIDKQKEINKDFITLKKGDNR